MERNEVQAGFYWEGNFLENGYLEDRGDESNLREIHWNDRTG
jgi:hypothetical protein